MLSLCKQLMPDQNFLYIMDDANAPYGSKQKEEIESIILELVTREIASNPNIKMVVLACNTATACAIQKLRQYSTVPIVGIEPATKPALEHCSKNDKILVLSTPLTQRYAKSIQTAKKTSPEKLLFFTPEKLAKAIDNNITHLDDLLPWLHDILEPYKHKCVKHVVLGCTHYAYLQKQISAVLGDVRFHLSEQATAMQACRVARNLNLSGAAKLEFRSTGKVRRKKMKLVFEEFFGT